MNMTLHSNALTVTPEDSNARQSNLTRFLILLLVCFALAGAAAGDTIANQDCLDCHTDPTNQRSDKSRPPLGIFPTNTFALSVHGKLQCVDCHRGVTDLVHPSRLPPAQCASCHDAQTNH